MNVEEMVIKYSLKPRGVIQVGSHHGEEQPIWDRLRLEYVCHFEPIANNFLRLVEATRDSGMKMGLMNCALGNRQATVRMNTETINGGQSCSVLAPKSHLHILPWICFDGTEDVQMFRLDDIGTMPCVNFMYVDAQGYELEIFKGSINVLKQINFIFTEVNRAEVFEGCGQIGELDSFLADQGFKRVETEWHGGDFGDSLYVKQ